MIEEVVNSILQAEDAAKQKTEQAQRQASETVAAAEIQAEQAKRQAAAHRKEQYSVQVKRIEQDARAQADALLQKLNAQTDEELSRLDSRVEGAVKIILESL